MNESAESASAIYNLILLYVEHQTVGESIDDIVQQANKKLEDMNIPSVYNI